MLDTTSPPGDPITFAVIKNAMDAIVDEVAYTVIRTARSEIVKDVMDYSAAICDAKGEMVAQAKTIAQHLGAIPEAMAAVQAKWSGRLEPGDAVIMNDPYSGGMHLPDIFMFFPIFEGADVLAWSVVICHHTDVGGRVPGSNAADSTEIYQEGLRIPPLKLFHDGTMDETLESMISLNVRVPDRVIGDLRAQYAACQVGAREIGRLVARYGAARMRGIFRRAYSIMPSAWRALKSQPGPKGTYRFTDHIDSDGMSDDPVPLNVAVTVRGDGTLKVDWHGSSRQVRAAINSTLSFTKSNTFLSVRCALRGDIPNNAGVFRCIEVTAPEGSVLNPIPPAPVAARALTGYRVMDTMFGALAQIVPAYHARGGRGREHGCLPRRTPSGQPPLHHRRHDQRLLGRPSRQGRHRGDHQSVAKPLQHAGRDLGARSIRCASRTMRWCQIPAVRGAIAAAWVFSARIVCWPMKQYCNCAPTGCGLLLMDSDGGEPGGVAGNWLGEGGAKRAIPGKVTMIMRCGELLTHHQAGGGGHGDPFNRAPEAVAYDVWNGKVTPASARERFGVVVDSKGEVDLGATKAIRSSRSKIQTV